MVELERVFAVFLLHTNPNGASELYKNWVQSIYASTNGVMCIIYIGLLLVAIFMAAVLVDQIRILLWGLLTKVIEKVGAQHGVVNKIWNYKSKI